MVETLKLAAVAYFFAHVFTWAKALEARLGLESGDLIPALGGSLTSGQFVGPRETRGEGCPAPRVVEVDGRLILRRGKGFPRREWLAAIVAVCGFGGSYQKWYEPKPQSPGLPATPLAYAYGWPALLGERVALECELKLASGEAFLWVQEGGESRPWDPAEGLRELFTDEEKELLIREKEAARLRGNDAPNGLRATKARQIAEAHWRAYASWALGLGVMPPLVYQDQLQAVAREVAWWPRPGYLLPGTGPSQCPPPPPWVSAAEHWTSLLQSW